MSENHVTRPEFDIYVSMTAQAIESIAKSQEVSSAAQAEQAKEATETNKILREYIITNNHKHEKTDLRINSLAELHSKEFSQMKKEIKKIKGVVKSREDVYKMGKALKWALGIVASAVLTVSGAYVFNNAIINKQKDTQKAKIEVPTGKK